MVRYQWMTLSLSIIALLHTVHTQTDIVNVGKGRGQFATQPDTWLGYTADLALDSDINSDIDMGHCAVIRRSSWSPLWWMVDLGSQHAIHYATVYSASEFVGDLGKIALRVSHSGNIDDHYSSDESVCGVYPSDTVLVSVTLECSPPKEGRYVSITRVARGMVLCEIKIMGRKIDCQPGDYGGRCVCNEGCSNVTCDAQTGSCQCNDGYYGDTCYSRCSRGCDGVCDPDNGECDCWNGYYGDKCQNQCSDGCTDTCDTTTGSCTCKTGWYGEKCDLDAPTTVTAAPQVTKTSSATKSSRITTPSSTAPTAVSTAPQATKTSSSTKSSPITTTMTTTKTTSYDEGDGDANGNYAGNGDGNDDGNGDADNGGEAPSTTTPTTSGEFNSDEASHGDDHDEEDYVGFIAAFAVGGLVILILIAVVAYLCYRIEKQPKTSTESGETKPNRDRSSAVTMTYDDIGPRQGPYETLTLPALPSE